MVVRFTYYKFSKNGEKKGVYLIDMKNCCSHSRIPYTLHNSITSPLCTPPLTEKQSAEKAQIFFFGLAGLTNKSQSAVSLSFFN